MLLKDLLIYTINQAASDLHITVGVPPIIRKDGKLIKTDYKKMLPTDTEELVKILLNEAQMEEYTKRGEIDFSTSMQGIGRFRLNVFKQRGSSSIAIRMVNLTIPSLKALGLPDIVCSLSRKPKGLILVTGPTGSGKSTTLASMIDQMNDERNAHILTLEDPIEFLHRHRNCIINQREIGSDTHSYATALKAALREDPDVILVGEMRDIETISIAITAAETGHLVLSTLHTIGAANTIDRIIDVFPPYQQQQIKVQLSMVLQGVVSQQLLKLKDKPGRIPAVEVMVSTPAIRNLIREGKTHQITSLIQTGAKFGMQTMDSSLADLCNRNLISYEDAMIYASDQDSINRFVK